MYCGSVHDYWDKYKAEYGVPNKNISNWINAWDSHSADWGDLLNLASAWGMNPIWIYAYDVNQNVLFQFCNAAWQTHYLYRYGRHIVERWKCQSPNCLDCDWPDGQWTLDVSYVDAYQWFEY